MSKTYYSYKNCLTYFLGLFRKCYSKELFLSKQEEIYHDLIALCESSPANFWALLQEQRLSYFEYRGICQKIKSYLLKREPVPYINRKCSFFNIPIKIEKGVFIPQPDSEILVSAVLFLSKKIWPSVEKNKVLEIGCGSGNIAIVIASKRLFWDVFAVDINSKALSLAKKNAFELNVSNVQFFFSDQFSKVTSKFHIIVSNPPYISSSEYSSLDSLTRKQPSEALLSADNGYFFYESIISNISCFLEKKFLVAFEMGCGQGERIIKIILKYFPYVKVKTFKDFSGNARVIAFYQR